MQMAVPLFFIFTMHAVFNSQLSLFLSRIGYTATQVGLLAAVIQLFGTVVPLLLVPVLQKVKNYGIPLFIYGVLYTVSSVPLLMQRNFWAAAAAVAVFAVGLRSTIPLSDTVIRNLLKDECGRYGQVRSVGTLSYVLMQIVLQLFCHAETADPLEMTLWAAVPGVLYCISLFLVPGLMTGRCGLPDPSIRTGQPQQHAAQTTERKKSWKDEYSGMPPLFWAGMAMVFFAYIAIASYSYYLSMYVVEALHLHAASLMWAVSAAAEMPFMFFSGVLVKKWGSERLLYIAVATISVRLILYVLLPSFGGLIAGQLLHSLSYGLFHPVVIAFIIALVPPEKLVTGITVYSILAQGFGQLVGGMVGGAVIDSFGYGVLFLGSAVFPIMGILLFIFWKRRLDTAKTPEHAA